MRWTQPLLTAALVASLAACADDSSPTAASSPAGAAPALSMNASTSRVVGYFPTYSGSPSTIDYSRLTHIAYAFVDPTASGGLTGVPMSGDTRLQDLVSRAHAAG